MSYPFDSEDLDPNVEPIHYVPKPADFYKAILIARYKANLQDQLDNAKRRRVHQGGSQEDWDEARRIDGRKVELRAIWAAFGFDPGEPAKALNAQTQWTKEQREQYQQSSRWT